MFVCVCPLHWKHLWGKWMETAHDWNICEENVQKLLIIRIFLRPRGIALSKIARLYPKCITIFASSAKKMNGNCWWTVQPTDRPNDGQQQSNLPSLLRKGGGHKYYRNWILLNFNRSMSLLLLQVCMCLQTYTKLEIYGANLFNFGLITD